MKLLIDADGCPVVDICIRLAKKNAVECFILCDTSHVFEREGATTITVSKGADSVDFALVNRVDQGDVVVTQDYGLAGQCVSPKGRLRSARMAWSITATTSMRCFSPVIRRRR